MPRKILIVDDNAINREVLKNTLSRDYDVLEAKDGKEAFTLIGRNYKLLSAILTDIVMPEMDGYELLIKIRENVLFTQIPVIMVTGFEDEESRVKALMLGANDFILKPFNPDIMLHCVKNNIALRETASILNAIQKDKLTGLYNREAFFERVAAAVKDREPGFYFLSCFDIDNFKLINDQYGAAEGDRILREIGHAVNENMEAIGGIGGRISGDNFAALLTVENLDFSITRAAGQERMKFLAQQNVVFSVGRYIINDPALPASTIYDRAYIAKQSVKGRYDKHIAYFDEVMLKKLISDQQITADMGGAVSERQFEVWFQPQRNHSTGALVGAEALVRWRHPKKGLIPPGNFIPVFEQNGFVYELDKYVWEETCRYIRKWLDEGRDPLPVSVNVSRYDVFRADFIATLVGLINKYEIPAGLLRLEITESAFAGSTKEIVEIVKQLIEKGFTVEIDDFGSGYSSLNTLKNVPAQVLKLDMRFLEGDDDSGRGGNILESIVRMAKWLGMAVIAEGVEEKAQADYLASVGCSYIQGYLYARPMPASEYESYCRSIGKEERLLSMEAAVNLNNNSFWNPASMDTLIFNSFVGSACIFEYSSRNVELLLVNDKFTALLGDGTMSVEDVLKLDWITCLTPESLALVRDILRRSAETGEEYTGEYEFLKITEGQPRTWLRSTMRVIATAGERMLVYCTSDNITKQKEELERARAAAEQLQAMVRDMPGGIAVYEVRPRALDKIRLACFSDGFCRLFGYTREEYAKLAEINPLGLATAGEISNMYEKVLALVRDGTPLDVVYLARVKGGAVKWINVKAVMGEQNGDILTVNAVFVDATEQKNASEELRISEEIYRLAIAQSRTIVCRYDVAARRLSISPNINPIFGVAPIEEDIPGKAVRGGEISPDTVDAYTAFYASIQRGDKNGKVLFQRRSSAGWRWIEANFTAIFADSGAPVTAVISFADVTESIEKDAAYQKWQRSIRSRTPESYSLFHYNISKGTALGAAEGLLIPAPFAEDASGFSRRTADYTKQYVCREDRQRFLSMLDRDAILLRHSQGRRTDSLEYRENLPDGCVRWLRLTVDIADSPTSDDVEAYLLFENIDAAKRTELNILERAETDPLTGLLNRTAFEERFAQFVSTRKPDTLSALFIIDLDGFKQVNDRFGHAAGDQTLIELGRKLLTAFREEDLICRLGGDEFLIYMRGVTHLSAIRDRASLLCALLHKSFSLDIQLSASIGISVCPKNGEDFETLYRKADAALYHVKEMGKDSYAVYTESMGDKPDVPEETAPEEGSAPQAAVHDTPKRRMLIVEDNEVTRDYLMNLFDEDFIIETAAEGTAALIRLRRYGAGISIVLLDLMMPGLDGFAVLKKMRENIVMQSIPVVVVSGMNEREACIRAIKEGAADFITKPVDADILKLRVASALSKAENDQLRAQNRYLALQNEEAKRLTEARRHSEELSVALHEAERADLAKSKFLSSMSHEIRTPLNAVIGYNTIARGEMDKAKTDEERRQVSMKVLDCLTKSEVASRHLLTIINDVLDMSAIESGKMKVDQSPFDFKNLITSLTVLFFSQARAKGVDFEVLFDKPAEEWFAGDQLRINQVLTNLLSNAVKFTPDGGRVTLTITENVIDGASTAFRFVVSDTGIGMPPEYLAHIWTPFEQAEASISRRFGGTGLGLSITKNLVALMNGTIAVESKPGEGSTFTVELTLSRTEQPQKPTHYDFTGVNALVVDDDLSTCDYIKLLFDRCGARCMTFTSGERAIEAFSSAKENEAPFNVCLVDWRMPEMDGFATISEIRRIAAKELPIVVVTAYDFSEVSDHAQNLGISRFISKPLFQSSLFDLLANISGKQTPHAAERLPKYDFDGARLLLVEDNNMNMEVAKHILLLVGFAVDSAWNGQEAIDIFTASRPGAYRAILMDVHMPEVDGYEATRAIRASGHPDAGSVPIIAMTADVFAEDVAEARAAGMNDHIAKPIDVDALYKMLEKYMEGEKA